MKKQISAAIAALILLPCIGQAVGGQVHFKPIITSAAGVVSSGDCGKNCSSLTWELDDSGTLTISGSGEMADYTEYASSAAPWRRLNVKRVVIGGGVTYLGKSAFTADSIEAYEVMDGSSCFSAADGVLFSQDGAELVSFPRGKKASSYTLPANVRRIQKGAFKNVCGLSAVVLPDGLESIGDEAFMCCRSLSSISVPDTVNNIGRAAFSRCNSLKEVSIGRGVTALENNMFEYSPLLRNVELSEGLITIGTEAFYDCADLETITIPDSVREIGTGAFSDCGHLRSVHLGSGIKVIGEEAFKDSRMLTDIDFPDGLEVIEEAAFFGCAGLKEITIPSTVTEVKGSSCVMGNLNDGSSYYRYNGAFTGCIGLERVVFEGAVQSIGNSVFGGCTGLKTVVLPEGVKRIEEYAFANCPSLERINFPDSLYRIGAKAFLGCSGLKNITLPKNISNVNQGTFKNCFGLENVEIPQSDNGLYIASEAFGGCVSLKDMDFGSRRVEMAEDSFDRFGNDTKYSYELFALNDTLSTLYNSDKMTLYIRTDNPDPDGFSIISDADIYKKPSDFQDIAFKSDSDRSEAFRAVDGGYIWSFRILQGGSYRLFAAERDGNDLNIGAEYRVTVKDSGTEREKWFGDVLESCTDGSRSNFDNMASIADYLISNFRYYANDGANILSLASVPDAPFFAVHSWDSFVSPSVLCEFARRLGGFDELADLYNDYDQYGYLWSNAHHLAYCRAGDVSREYTAYPVLSTGRVDYKTIDFSDSSCLFELKNCQRVNEKYSPITFYGSDGSNAKELAAQYGFGFGDAIVTGDLNGDNAVTVADLVCLEEYLLGTGRAGSTKKADLYADGKIDVYDLVMLRKAVLSK